LIILQPNLATPAHILNPSQRIILGKGTRSEKREENREVKASNDGFSV